VGGRRLVGVRVRGGWLGCRRRFGGGLCGGLGGGEMLLGRMRRCRLLSVSGLRCRTRRGRGKRADVLMRNGKIRGAAFTTVKGAVHARADVLDFHDFFHCSLRCSGERGE